MGASASRPHESLDDNPKDTPENNFISFSDNQEQEATFPEVEALGVKEARKSVAAKRQAEGGVWPEGG